MRCKEELKRVVSRWFNCINGIAWRHKLPSLTETRIKRNENHIQDLNRMYERDAGHKTV